MYGFFSFAIFPERVLLLGAHYAGMKSVLVGLLIGATILVALDAIGDLYNKSNPVVKAGFAALETMRRNGPEADRIAEEIHQLAHETFERRFGRKARLRLEAEELTVLYGGR
jgi:hypothetical protein